MTSQQSNSSGQTSTKALQLILQVHSWVSFGSVAIDAVGIYLFVFLLVISDFGQADFMLHTWGIKLSDSKDMFCSSL